MWLVWIVALVLIGVGAVLWMHRLDNIGADGTPPYDSAGSATDGSEDDDHHPPEAL